jgi:hypothetical protein
MQTNAIPYEISRISILLAIVCGLSQNPLAAQTNIPAPEYHIYSGNTHSHTSNTWSHGEQYAKVGKESGDGKEPGLYVTPDGAQYPAKTAKLKPNWQKFQGPPSAHFALAKSNSYDFYAVTDHSQEAAFQPPSPTNVLWLAMLRAAREATDGNFVAITGYEHSENNGPGGVGHINVFNTAEYLNALAPGIDLPYLYHWLKTAQPNGEGPVVASFNHPGPRQYNNWDYRDPEITDIITMLEVINSNNKIRYQAFVNALDKGWKVSPVCGNDNHGYYGITHHASRTFVLATNKTKVAILDAMKHRRTYAALAKNLQCRFTVNGQVMGSTLDQPTNFEFNILTSDPDTNKHGNKITKLDIVKDGGAVAESYQPTPSFSVSWQPSLHDATNKYFFVRVWNAGGGDAPGAKPNEPAAWLAPVWTGR